ncbi:MAG: hypothetical protein ACR2G7_00270 [Acidimicrobiales bacterium]
MFTVMVCLVVVALSGAAVLRITLGDDPQRATTPPRPGVEDLAERPEDPSLTPSQAGPEVDGAAGPRPGGGDARASGSDGPGSETPPAVLVEAPPVPPATRRPSDPAVSTAPVPVPGPAQAGAGRPDRDDGVAAGRVGPGSRLRSGVLLVVLLATLGAVLAMLVAVTLVLLVLALQAALG